MQTDSLSALESMDVHRTARRNQAALRDPRRRSVRARRLGDVDSGHARQEDERQAEHREEFCQLTTTNPPGATALKTANDKHMKTNIKVSDTRYPRLTRAVLRRVDRESLKDVVNHGAGGGVSGFTYYTDTLAFYKAHKGDILAMAQAMAEDLGEDMLAMIAGFGCLKDEKLSQTSIAEALYSGRGDDATSVRNAMAWFALEEVARELNPEI